MNPLGQEAGDSGGTGGLTAYLRGIQKGDRLQRGGFQVPWWIHAAK